jgi:hypothetical protein
LDESSRNSLKEVSVADITTARPGLAGRDRVRADSETGAGYRTFPSKLPVILTALGGGLIALGSLGASVRASAITRLREDPKTVRILMGSDSKAGWIVAAFGLALAVASFVWLRRSRLLKFGVTGLLVVTVALVAGRLRSFDDRAAMLAEQARRSPDFVGFHAGFGWGAWCMLIGAILAGFGLLIGVLRELDLRKGNAG